MRFAAALLACSTLSLATLHASAPPLICPGGTPLGRFDLTVTPKAGGVAHPIETVNQLLPGDTITYHPLEVDSFPKKKVRMALLLVPSNGSKITVFDPKPVDEPSSWTVPFRTQLASVVWGPQGLDKSKVNDLVVKDEQLIAQLADYAAKTAETQALIDALARKQQVLDTGQSVDAAVAGFASQFPAARLDRTQPTDVQLGVLLHSVNPSLAAYDPLAQSPQQQAAQTAGLAAAVGGLFLGGSADLAVAGGGVLVSLHGVLFPHTQFLSALAQHGSDSDSNSTSLCGSAKPALAHTEPAFLWAFRVPDSPAPSLALKSIEHLPIGQKSSVPLTADAKNWNLVPRVQSWIMIPEDPASNVASIPVKAQVNTSAKTIELDLSNSRLKPGNWKLAGSWDWDPLPVSGTIVLHNLSTFTSAHLTPQSQDQLTSGAGTVDLDLTGDDFEFVKKVEYKKQGDPFAEPETVPFHLPKEPVNGPESSIKVRLDAKPLSTGSYVFLIAQTDGKEHETPFKVLPSAPAITGTPILLNTGMETQTVTLHGSGLDRIEQISAADRTDVTFELGDPGSGDTRAVTVKLKPGIKPGAVLSLNMKVTNFEQPVSADDVFEVTGPKPTISSVREAVQDAAGVATRPDEMGANSLVSFEMNVAHAPVVSEVDLSCENGEAAPLKIKPGDAKDDLKVTQESADTLFLAFRPRSVGPPGCAVMVRLVTPKSGPSDRRRLGTIVLLPQIDSFDVTSEKAGDSSWFATLKGRDLEGITKVGWYSNQGTDVDAIPVPVPGPGNVETLRVAVPWPAPAPHAPLFIWLRGENQGRQTSAKY
ncbi:MAG TPA: hypothetical protein VHC90_19370 [Bryobacteraceae bacterium]|nr:hypothetical protein [Bryobacteraceae bacterium]